MFATDSEVKSTLVPFLLPCLHHHMTPSRLRSHHNDHLIVSIYWFCLRRWSGWPSLRRPSPPRPEAPCGFSLLPLSLVPPPLDAPPFLPASTGSTLPWANSVCWTRWSGWPSLRRPSCSGFNVSQSSMDFRGTWKKVEDGVVPVGL